LVDKRGIVLPLLRFFSSNTPSQEYLSFGIPYRVYTTQLYQFIGQCRSRHILGFSIEEIHVVGTRYTLIKQQHRVLGF